MLVLVCAVLPALLVDASACPTPCECKWRGGKEAVSCVRANLSAIPPGLDAGTQLLDVSDNPLRPAILPADAFLSQGLINLQKVFLSRCGLRAVDRAALRGLANLVELDLSGNLLVAVPSAALVCCLPELRELRLSNNPISRVRDSAFTGLARLVRLELSSCRIFALDAGAFLGLEVSLEWLRLDGNRLEAAGVATALRRLGGLHGLALAKNPWNCSCELRPFKVWLEQGRVPMGDEPPQCQSPPRLAGRSWTRLDADDFACRPSLLATATPTVAVLEGGDATLHCPVDAMPSAHVRWMARGRSLTNRSRTLYLPAPDGVLTLLGAEMQDAGPYLCLAENRAGRVQATVMLSVQRRPPPATADALSGRVVAAGIAVAALLVLASALVAVCACGLRRRGGHHHQRGRLDISTPSATGAVLGGSYEKIELNHHGGGDVGGGKVATLSSGGNSTQESAEQQHPRHAEYRGVPCGDTDDEEAGYEEEEETPTPTSPAPDLHIPRVSTWSSTAGSRAPTQFKPTTTTAASSPPAQLSASSLTAHVMHRRDLGPGGGNLYTSDYPDLLPGSGDGGGGGGSSRVSSTLPRRGRYGGGGSGGDSQSPLLGPNAPGGSMLSLASQATGPAANSVTRRSNNGSSNRPQNPSLPTSPVPLLSLRASDLMSYDYHAAQLERFLEEYRSLQQQLSLMKQQVDGGGGGVTTSSRRGRTSGSNSSGEYSDSTPPYWVPRDRRYSGGDFYQS